MAAGSWWEACRLAQRRAARVDREPTEIPEVDDMPVNAVSHVSLTVTDLKRSRAWYTEVLEWNEQAVARYAA